MAAKKTTTKSTTKALQRVDDTQIENVNPHNLILAAIDKGVDIGVMEKLLDMRERLQREMAERAFREAMSGFQSECPVIPKRKGVYDKSGKLRYKYAPLEDIVAEVQPLLRRYGLSFTVNTETNTTPEGIEASVTICHVLGAERHSVFFAPIQRDAYMSDPQKWASASTFAKRYAFCNAFGILTGDEDNDATICDSTTVKLAAKKPIDAETLAHIKEHLDTARDVRDLQNAASIASQYEIDEATREELRAGYEQARARIAEAK